jgi:ribonuclease HI
VKISAYVDGSYDSVGHIYGGGVAIQVEGIEAPLSLKVHGNDKAYERFRNVAGELLATMTAINVAREVGCTELEIYYDYEGIAKWINGEWQARKQIAIKYQMFVRAAQQLMTISFHKVRAHSGDKLNELADKLAKEAVREAMRGA